MSLSRIRASLRCAGSSVPPETAQLGKHAAQIKQKTKRKLGRICGIQFLFWTAALFRRFGFWIEGTAALEIESAEKRRRSAAVQTCAVYFLLAFLSMSSHQSLTFCSVPSGLSSFGPLPPGPLPPGPL